MIENVDRPTEPLNEEGVQAIRNGAMHILENIGIEILNDEARQIFADAGCIVNIAKMSALGATLSWKWSRKP